MICDVLNGQRTLRERLEQSRLLLFVEQPLKSTFFEHPILTPTLMLRGHRRPQSRVQTVGSSDTLHHSRGAKSFQNPANSCFLSSVKFGRFVKRER